MNIEDMIRKIEHNQIIGYIMVSKVLGSCQFVSIDFYASYDGMSASTYRVTFIPVHGNIMMCETLKAIVKGD